MKKTDDYAEEEYVDLDFAAEDGKSEKKAKQRVKNVSSKAAIVEGSGVADDDDDDDDGDDDDDDAAEREGSGHSEEIGEFLEAFSQEEEASSPPMLVPLWEAIKASSSPFFLMLP